MRIVCKRSDLDPVPFMITREPKIIQDARLVTSESTRSHLQFSSIPYNFTWSLLTDQAGDYMMVSGKSTPKNVAALRRARKENVSLSINLRHSCQVSCACNHTDILTLQTGTALQLLLICRNKHSGSTSLDELCPKKFYYY
ncbi:jg20707 [Pararge aegeria aegeria]|uniref:Jg20707 protein n=1 Tax=Pararge aegeria aegeria TaxID=348720 RepID=A0A8S4QS33_9NEOP|nr:jg20707 [Pararge aegeria aegeria]